MIARTVPVLLLLNLACFLSPRATAESLEPIRGFHDVVQVCPHVETFGHAPYELVKQLQAEILVRLAKAEVPAVAPDDCSKTVGEGFLWVNLRASPSTSGDVYAYVVDVELAQDARLIRDPKTVIEAVTTWRVLKLGVTRPAELEVTLNDLALELVDVFIKIYKEKN